MGNSRWLADILAQAAGRIGSGFERGVSMALENRDRRAQDERAMLEARNREERANMASSDMYNRAQMDRERMARQRAQDRLAEIAARSATNAQAPGHDPTALRFANAALRFGGGTEAARILTPSTVEIPGVERMSGAPPSGIGPGGESLQGLPNTQLAMPRSLPEMGDLVTQAQKASDTRMLERYSDRADIQTAAEIDRAVERTKARGATDLPFKTRDEAVREEGRLLSAIRELRRAHVEGRTRRREYATELGMLERDLEEVRARVRGFVPSAPSRTRPRPGAVVVPPSEVGSPVSPAPAAPVAAPTAPAPKKAVRDMTEAELLEELGQ